MTSEALLVADVVIPARNESDNIADCLRAVAAQDVGAARLAVVVADGRSTDSTVEIIDQLRSELGFASLEVVDNPELGISSGLNRAVKRCGGPVVVRVDARSRLGPQHVRIAVEILSKRPEVVAVGGPQRAIVPVSGLVGEGIARALRNRWSTGLARYRWARIPESVDTVWMGAFRRSELEEVGGWDEGLVLNEDYELFERLRERGLVWFEPAMSADYRPRTTLSEIRQQYLRYGRAKGRRWRAGASISTRHAVVLGAPVVGVAAVGVLVRRHGLGPTVAASLVALAVVDAVGADEPAPLRVRFAAMGTTLTLCGSWWIGALTGLAGSAPRGGDSASRVPRGHRRRRAVADRRAMR